MSEKGLMRRTMLALRSALPEAERTRKSRELTHRLIALDVFSRAKSVMAYASYGHEVQTDFLFENIWGSGATLILPKVIPAEKRMSLHVVKSRGDLEIGFAGIREPVASTVSVSAGQVDVVIVPGLAFDRLGGRLGFGGGYYDRFLPLVAKTTAKIGLGFDVQLVDEIPSESHDINLDFLVTESIVLNFGAGRAQFGTHRN